MRITNGKVMGSEAQNIEMFGKWLMQIGDGFL